MATTLKIKNSAVAGKAPSASDLVTAELALNLADRKLYSKDVDGNIFQIGGEGANVPSGDTPPPTGNEIGDLFFDTTTDSLLYWNGLTWLPIAGDDALALDDLSDVDVAGATDGQVLTYVSNEWVAQDPAKLDTGGSAPDNPSLGDLWVDTADCPPTLNIWDDCSNPGNPSWTPIGGGGGNGLIQGVVQIVSNSGSELFSTLTAVGGSGVDKDGATVNATYAWTGAKTGTGTTIIADVEGDYTVTATVTADGTTLNNSDDITITDTYVPMANATAPVISVIGAGPVYPGSGLSVSTNATVTGGSLVEIVETQWYKDNVLDGTELIYSLQDDDVDAEITCKQRFRDVRNNELLSEVSNTLTVIALPLDVINFTVSVYDNGNNFVGNILTADANNLSGGVAPEERYYQWYQDGIATSIAKYRTIPESDVGKVITCDVTCAEPDGSNPVTKTGTYGSIPEAGTNPPVVNSVALVATGDGSARFDDQSFTATIDLTEGEPVSTKSYEYKVEGTLSVQPSTSEIVGAATVTVPGGWTTVPAVSSSWKAITYGNGKYVAVAIGGTNRVMYSSDGLTWQPATAPEQSWQDVAYGNGKYVAVSLDGNKRVMYSTDAITWSISGVTTPGSDAYSSVTYGDGKFVAVSRDGTKQVIYSTDGISWTGASTPEQNSWWSVTYGGGKFVAVASSGTNRVMFSTNGTSGWTQATAAEANNWYGVTYGNGKYVAVSQSGTNRIMYSSDAMSWIPVQAPEQNSWIDVAYGDGKFVAVSTGGANQIMWSADAITWTSASVDQNSNWISVIYGADKFVAVTQNGTNRAMWSEYGNDGYSTTELTLADNTGLDDFTDGMLVQQNVPITGTAPAFSTTLYDGSNNQQTIDTGVDFTTGGLVWIKNRESNQSHALTDTIRGANSIIKSDTTGESVTGGINSFNNSGYVLQAYGENGNNVWTNQAGRTYVSWNFRKAPKFFDIQTWTGNGDPTRVLNHSLTTTPGFIINKATNNAGTQWYMYHKDLGLDSYISFNSSPAPDSTGAWNSITDTTFGVGTSANLNGDGREMVSYLFAADEPGLIKCGSYPGVSMGTTIDCGFKPGWVMVKSTTLTGGNQQYSHWYINDDKRNNGISNDTLAADVSTAENGSTLNCNMTFTATGFTVEDRGNPGLTQDGHTYIYVAIAENAMADASVTPAGLFQSYDDTTDPAAPTMTLTSQVDGWQVNDDKTAVGPTTVLDDATLYLETNNLRQVTGTSAAPVAYETIETSDEITFDLPTGTGQTWDEEFPVDSTITACVVADNTTAGGGRSPATGTICSNVLQPEDADNVSDIFATTLYTGNGTEQTITTGIDNTDKSLVWIKSRSAVDPHNIYDTVRGPMQMLNSNGTSGSQTFPPGLSSFLSSGFVVLESGQHNENNVTFAAWNFKASPKFFDIQTWTGNNTIRQIPHYLTSVPGMLIVKPITTTGSWYVWHKEIGITEYLRLNNTAGAKTDIPDLWDETLPTNTEFSINANGAVNGAGEDFIAYLFADEAGLIKCGKTGTLAVNEVVDCGFEPQFILAKQYTPSNTVSNWIIVDNKRTPSLHPDNTDAENPSNTVAVAFVENGFKVTDKPGRLSDCIFVAIAAPVVKSMTQEQVNNTKLLFQTKGYREEKYTQDLLARGADLRASLLQQGYTAAEIDGVLGKEAKTKKTK